MKAIVTHQDNFHYMKFQPGDGTLYTVLFGNMVRDPDNMYIAIGSADYIRGGYFFRKSSVRELAYEMLKWIKNDSGSLFTFVSEYHYFDYQHTKINVFHEKDGNIWTTAVAVLFAVVYALGDVSNDADLAFIGHVYNNHALDVLALFAEWGLPVDETILDTVE